MHKISMQIWIQGISGSVSKYLRDYWHLYAFFKHGGCRMVAEEMASFLIVWHLPDAGFLHDSEDCTSEPP